MLPTAGQTRLYPEHFQRSEPRFLRLEKPLLAPFPVGYLKTERHLERAAREKSQKRGGRKVLSLYQLFLKSWGGRIRTLEWRYQKPLPYRLATPQQLGKTAPIIL